MPPLKISSVVLKETTKVFSLGITIDNGKKMSLISVEQQNMSYFLEDV